MKQILYAIASIAFFFLMLCFPKETLEGAKEGLLLWFQIVLPTLLPFLIATNLLISTNSIFYISRLCGPLFQRLFCVSPNGSFAVLAGFLCGYPVGAKVTADMVKTNRITLTEGKYLLSFCNNTSPAFITGYIVMQNLKEETLMFPTLLILYLSPVLCSFIFRRWYHIRPRQTAFCKTQEKPLFFTFDILDHGILNAFETITKIGGYIILFSILFSFGKRLPSAVIFSLLEITNGIPCILSSISNIYASYTLVLALSSFGGICAIAQTKAMLGGTKLSIVFYTLEKLITAAVTSLLALSYIKIVL